MQFIAFTVRKKRIKLNPRNMETKNKMFMNFKEIIFLLKIQRNFFLINLCLHCKSFFLNYMHKYSFSKNIICNRHKNPKNTSRKISSIPLSLPLISLSVCGLIHVLHIYQKNYQQPKG